jgi:hypothetical protein
MQSFIIIIIIIIIYFSNQNRDNTECNQTSYIYLDESWINQNHFVSKTW